MLDEKWFQMANAQVGEIGNKRVGQIIYNHAGESWKLPSYGVLLLFQKKGLFNYLENFQKDERDQDSLW